MTEMHLCEAHSCVRSVEAILHMSNRPLSFREIAALIAGSEQEVRAAAGRLAEKYRGEESGVWLAETADEIQLVVHPKEHDAVESFIKSETVGELTRPQLEVLTVIAYRGPMTKEEIEGMRGVSCTLVLRNLMMRGLVQTRENGSGAMPHYQVTMDFLKYLGLRASEDLPDYGSLRADLQNEDETPLPAVPSEI